MKGNTSDESSSLIGDILLHLGFVDIFTQPLTSSWCATWLAVTRWLWKCWVVGYISECLSHLPAVASHICCHLADQLVTVSRVVLSKGLSN